MQIRTLSELAVGKSAIVRGFLDDQLTASEEKMVARLMELGFVKQTMIKIIHEAPFAHDPIAVEVRGKKIAIRRVDAKLILVEEIA